MTAQQPATRAGVSFLPGKGNSPSNTLFCGDAVNSMPGSIASHNCQGLTADIAAQIVPQTSAS
jgi:hypothetical protein